MISNEEIISRDRPNSSEEEKEFKFEDVQENLVTIQRHGVTSIRGSEAFLSLVQVLGPAGPGEVGELIDKYKTKKVFKYLVDALGSMRKKNVINKVVERLSSFKNKKFLEMFLNSLGYISPSDLVIRVLEDFIAETEVEELRETASNSLCKLMSNTSLSPPLGLLSCSESPCLRKMINCLTAMRAEGRYLGNILSAVQQTERQQDRKMAIRALG